MRWFGVGKFVIDMKYGVQSIFENFLLLLLDMVHLEILLEYEVFFATTFSRNYATKPVYHKILLLRLGFIVTVGGDRRQNWDKFAHPVESRSR